MLHRSLETSSPWHMQGKPSRRGGSNTTASDRAAHSPDARGLFEEWVRLASVPNAPLAVVITARTARSSLESRECPSDGGRPAQLRFPYRTPTLSGGRADFDLRSVSAQDGVDQAGKAVLELFAATDIAHFHPVPLTTNQSCFPQHLEMLGQRRFRDAPVTDLEELRAGCRRGRSRQSRVDGGSHRVRQGMENP
jgi:hypothetical protein